MHLISVKPVAPGGMEFYRNFLENVKSMPYAQPPSLAGLTLISA